MASVNILRAKDSVLVKTVRTSSKGEFAIERIAAGNYFVMVSYPQYADFTDQITVGATPTVLNIALIPKPIFLKKLL